MEKLCGSDSENSRETIKKMVSIILPTYNRAGQIGQAIESVLDQTYPWFELLVIDDGSTDRTEDVIKTYEDKRVKYFRTPQNGGASKARNYGMELAKYDYIAFEDSDDLWSKEKLEHQMMAMQVAGKDVGMVYHKIQYDLTENTCFLLPDEKISDDKKSGDIYAQLLYDNLVGMPSILVRRECLDKVGYLDESLKALEDYDFALRIAKEYKVEFLNEVLLHATYSTTGVSGNSINYLVASCILVGKFKQDYIRTGNLNHRLEIILNDAQRIGIKAQIVELLEKILQI